MFQRGNHWRIWCICYFKITFYSGITYSVYPLKYEAEWIPVSSTESILDIKMVKARQRKWKSFTLTYLPVCSQVYNDSSCRFLETSYCWMLSKLQHPLVMNHSKGKCHTLNMWVLWFLQSFKTWCIGVLQWPCFNCISE